MTFWCKQDWSSVNKDPMCKQGLEDVTKFSRYEQDRRYKQDPWCEQDSSWEQLNSAFAPIHIEPMHWEDFIGANRSGNAPSLLIFSPTSHLVNLSLTNSFSFSYFMRAIGNYPHVHSHRLQLKYRRNPGSTKTFWFVRHVCFLGCRPWWSLCFLDLEYIF